MIAGINLLCLTLATPYAVAAAPGLTPSTRAPFTGRQQSLYTGKGEGTIHSICLRPVDDSEGDQV